LSVNDLVDDWSSQRYMWGVGVSGNKWDFGSLVD